MKSLKSKKKKLVLTSFSYFSREMRLGGYENLFGYTNQDSTISHTPENSKNVKHNFKIF